MRNPTLSAVTLVALTIGGCASVSPPPTRSALLSNTEWALIDVRQPPSAEPADVALNKYQLSLAAAGTVALVLDCNRGTGDWTATGERSGTIRFGPVAATTALCPDDGLGERLGRDLSGKWPYEIDDGRLTIRTSAATYTFDAID